MAEVSGRCHADFEAVRDAFAHNFAAYDEVGAAVTITVDGETVVDLWGGTAEPASGRAWEEHTRVVVFSCTKAATALCAHMLADRGALDLDAPVGEYWPEFATNGKEEATVSMMLDHSVGVPALSGTLEAGAMYDWGTMVDALARQAPWWKPGTRNGYHLITFGWTVGELVRRVSGRSLGTFFREEVAKPLGLEFAIGVQPDEDLDIAPIIAWMPTPDYDSAFTRSIVDDPTGIQGMGMANLIQAAIDYNAPEMHAAEIGGAGGVATARGLAGMYTPLAQGGGTLVDRDSVDRMRTVSVATHRDATLCIPTRFALGFMVSMDNRRTAENESAILGEHAFGHVGAGGSLGFADPSCGLAFGYAMNRQGKGILLNNRGQSLVDATYRALGFRSDAAGTWQR
jgi:CubicO group peptidase (beta-lactamase class C family)